MIRDDDRFIPDVCLANNTPNAPAPPGGQLSCTRFVRGNE